MIAVQVKVRQKNTQHSKIQKVLGADHNFEETFLIPTHISITSFNGD